jgi:hypothetical protein
MTHMHGGVISVIKGLSECCLWTAIGYLGSLGVGYFYGCGKLWNENSNNYVSG